MKVQHTEDVPIFDSHYDSDALQEMLDTQHKETEHTNNKNSKTYVQIFFILLMICR